MAALASKLNRIAFWLASRESESSLPSQEMSAGFSRRFKAVGTTLSLVRDLPSTEYQGNTVWHGESSC
jgi:hypothetical protein